MAEGGKFWTHFYKKKWVVIFPLTRITMSLDIITDDLIYRTVLSGSTRIDLKTPTNAHLIKQVDDYYVTIGPNGERTKFPLPTSLNEYVPTTWLVHLNDTMVSPAEDTQHNCHAFGTSSTQHSFGDRAYKCHHLC